jgi:co-chaperonin GroES (HSP10)
MAKSASRRAAKAAKAPAGIDNIIPLDGIAEAKESAKQLPQVKGYKMLVTLYQVKEVTDGGIYRPDQLRELEQAATVIGLVVAMGADCYKDEKRFPNGAYCKEGDFVLFRAYQGSRFKQHDIEFRIINDDTVEAVVEDPRGITRA